MVTAADISDEIAVQDGVLSDWLTWCVVIDGSRPCGAPARLHQRIPMCRRHRIEAINLRRASNASAATAALASDEAGVVYFLRTPAGTVKIGCSIELRRRLRDLHREFGGPVRLLASQPGGRALEAEMHQRFADSRVMDLLGEQFEPSDELLDYIDRTGIHTSSWDDIVAYAGYTPRSVRRPNPDYVRST